MKSLSLLASLCGAFALAAPASALQGNGIPPIDFDLVEISVAGHPQNPDIDYTYVPVSDFKAEAVGVAVADFNNDGYQDIFFPSTEGNGNHLYVNRGNGTFRQQAPGFGVDEPTKRRGMAAFFDLENDGDLDLMTLGYPSSPVQNLDLYSMFRNDGDPLYTFTDITAGVGGFALAPSAETTTVGDPGGVAVGDYNNDGYLDVFVTYWYRNGPPPGISDEDQSRLWKNVPNPNPDLGEPDYSPRLLVDATVESGLVGFGGTNWVWQPTWVDVNRDGLLDLHVNIEKGEDELRLNNGDGTFSANIATGLGMNYNGPDFPAGSWGHEMGAGVGDYDNDRDIDFYLTNPGTGVLGKADAFYRNDADFSLGGPGMGFTSIGPVTTDTDTDGVGWGAIFVDLDNDCDKDLLTARGLGSGRATNHLFLNEAPALAADGQSTALTEVGAQVPDFSRVGGAIDVMRGLVALDYDNDGDMDVVATRSGDVPVDPTDNMKAGFFLNTLNNSNNWLEVDLVEAGGSLNTVGSRVYVRTGGISGIVQMREVIVGSSYLSQEPYRLHFGLAGGPADWVAVRWFDGTMHVLRGNELNPIEGLTSITRANDFSGDLDGDLDTDCDDLELFTLGQASEAAVDAIVPGWPWRIVADADGNEVVDTRDFEQIRNLVRDTFCDIGGGLSGSHGVPTLVGSGTLTPGSTVTLALSDALENSSVWLVVGLSQANVPFKAGVMIPAPDVILGPFPVSGSGDLVLSGPWPADIPSDFQTTFQQWVQDPAAPVGFSGSNGVSLRAP